MFENNSLLQIYFKINNRYSPVIKGKGKCWSYISLLSERWDPLLCDFQLYSAISLENCHLVTLSIDFFQNFWENYHMVS
jgi:hypothetical protein